ncbi:WxL domain-containing protein [Enterococcus sp. DIV0187]|uniref:WxL domain-containing protein n=1 Tax=Enterococcus sp. DIV0187 TaxID=2774644 RepID=UPI003F267D20
MNKKKLSAALLGTAMMGGLLFQATPTSAATYSGQSTGSVSFKSGTLVTPPTDPDIDPGQTGGSFGLLYVPKEFNFAETAVPTSTVVGNTTIAIDTDWEGNPATDTGGAAGSNTATKRFAVGDVRGTRAAGWKLEAKLTTDLTDSGSSKSLTGATITMTQGINELDPTSAWAATATTAGAGAHTPDTVPAAVTLSTTSAVVMSASAESALNAADGRGEGYWQGEFTNINLNVPATPMNAVVAGEQYEGTIDWTLTDAI